MGENAHEMANPVCQPNTKSDEGWLHLTVSGLTEADCCLDEHSCISAPEACWSHKSQTSQISLETAALWLMFLVALWALCEEAGLDLMRAFVTLNRGRHFCFFMDL